MRVKLAFAMVLDLLMPGRKRAELARSLEQFVQETPSQQLDRETARRELETGIVEIFDELYYSHGLLVTGDGYFLTAKHCIEHLLQGFKKKSFIRTQEGIVYPLQKVVAVAESLDIALVKANIPAPPTPKRYMSCDDASSRTTVGLIVLQEGQFRVMPGLFNVPFSYERSDDGWETVYGKFRHFAQGSPGSSGSVVVTLPDLKIVGIHTGNHGTSSEGVKLRRALEMIDFYQKRL